MTLKKVIDAEKISANLDSTAKRKISRRDAKAQRNSEETFAFTRAHQSSSVTPVKKGEILPQRRKGAEKFRGDIRFYPRSSEFISDSGEKRGNSPAEAQRRGWFIIG